MNTLLENSRVIDDTPPYMLQVPSTAVIDYQNYLDSYNRYFELCGVTPQLKLKPQLPNLTSQEKSNDNKSSKRSSQKENDPLKITDIWRNFVDRINTGPNQSTDYWSNIRRRLNEIVETRPAIPTIVTKQKLNIELEWRRQHEIFKKQRRISGVEQFVIENQNEEVVPEKFFDEIKEEKKRLKREQKMRRSFQKFLWTNVKMTNYGELDLDWLSKLSPQEQFNIKHETPRKLKPEYFQSYWRQTQVFEKMEPSSGRLTYVDAYKETIQIENHLKRLCEKVKNNPDIFLLAPAWEKEMLVEQQQQQRKHCGNKIHNKSHGVDGIKRKSKKNKIWLNLYRKFFSKSWNSIPKNQFGEVDFDWYLSLAPWPRYKTEHETPSKMKPELVRSIWRQVEIDRIREDTSNISYRRAYELALRKERDLRREFEKVYRSDVCQNLVDLWEKEDIEEREKHYHHHHHHHHNNHHTNNQSSTHLFSSIPNANQTSSSHSKSPKPKKKKPEMGHQNGLKLSLGKVRFMVACTVDSYDK
ncbi:hypothetical protein G9A89_007714 [Geosiphon pyriformis]|nr:hypothetical protein G9A89_007714 [Geosiphon pyriformis]